MDIRFMCEHRLEVVVEDAADVCIICEEIAIIIFECMDAIRYCLLLMDIAMQSSIIELVTAFH